MILVILSCKSLPELCDGRRWSPPQRSSLSVDNDVDPWITVSSIVSTRQVSAALNTNGKLGSGIIRRYTGQQGETDRGRTHLDTCISIEKLH